MGLARFLLPFLLALAGVYGQTGETQSVDCSTCHEQSKTVATSAHAAAGCNGCHPKHKDYPHPENVAKPACGQCHTSQAGEHASSVHGAELKKGNQAAPDCAVCHGAAHEIPQARSVEYRKKVPELCGMCHGEVGSHYNASVHGRALAQGVSDAPVCTDCHGEHSIQRPSVTTSAVHPLHVRETCARCHGDLRLMKRFGLPSDRITSFDNSFHGLAAKAGSQTVANCASCHGFHDILPSQDKQSRTHPANLSKTCGQCHPGAGTRFAIGTIHLSEDGKEPAPVRWVRMTYQILIPALIGLMVLHHGADWLRKLLWLRLAGTPSTVAPPPQEPELRMYFWERVQHALLVVSFTVLVWTGFALKYPDQWWALPLVHFETAWPVRGVLHRIAGVIMIGVAVLHIVTLAVSGRLRRHWFELIPRASDVHEAWHGFVWRLGFLSKKPVLSPHGYVEKLEYWAVVWGTAVMALTGIALWANDWMLQRLPKVWLDVATSLHFYEALLATLAIVVWHLYSVIFDPEVYPMDPAWLTGKSVRLRHEPEAQVDPGEKVG